MYGLQCSLLNAKIRMRRCTSTCINETVCQQNRNNIVVVVVVELKQFPVGPRVLKCPSHNMSVVPAYILPLSSDCDCEYKPPYKLYHLDPLFIKQLVTDHIHNSTVAVSGCRGDTVTVIFFRSRCATGEVVLAGETCLTGDAERVATSGSLNPLIDD